MLVNSSGLLSIRELLQAVFRRRRLIVLMFILTVMPVCLATFTSPRKYSSTAKVLVRREDRPGALNPYYSRLNQEEDIRSELEIATSRPVLERALFNALANRQRFSDLGAELYLALAALRSSNGEPAGKHGGVVSLDPARAPRGMAPASTDDPMLEKAIERLRRHITVEAVTGANVIMLTFEDSNPHQAAWFANALANAYAAYNAEVYGNGEAETFLMERINESRAWLDSLEKEQFTFRTTTGMVAYDKQEAMVLDKYRSVDNQLAQLREQADILAAKMQRFREIRAASDSLYIPTSEMDAHPTVRQLYSRLTELRLERNALVDKYKPDHRFVVDINKQIDGVRVELVAEVDRLLTLENERLRFLRQEEQVLSKMASTVQGDMKELPGKERVLGELQLAIENARRIYSLLVLRREEMSVEKAADQRISRISIISAAGVPFEPVSPRPARNMILGLAIGFFGSLTVGLTREFLDRTFKSPHELALSLDLPVLCSISFCKGKNENVLRPALTQGEVRHPRNGHTSNLELMTDSPLTSGIAPPEVRIADQNDPMIPPSQMEKAPAEMEFVTTGMSLAGEDQLALVFRGRRLPINEIEKLRGEIIMLRRKQNVRIIGFASSLACEGTSTILANVALGLNRYEGRVLLVDMNPANQHLTELFSLSDGPGLVDLVDGRHNLQDAVRTIEQGKIFLLPLGRTAERQAIDLELASRCIYNAGKYSRWFDLILIDLPPMRDFPQALQAACNTDGTIQIVQAERTRVDVARSTMQEMERLGVKILGTILNKRRFHIPSMLYNQT